MYDDATDASNARTFASRLVNSDKVVAVLGTSAAGGSLAIAPVFDDAKIPMIRWGPASRSSTLCDPMCSTPHTDRMVCLKKIADIKARRFKRLAMINGTDGAGKTLRTECTAAAKAAAWKS